ncbi:MAG: flippase-like domain-containing protein [Clostridia bacterium]|nr:flippase-like domain-containing protein [Clostridia bacterium]
MKKIWINSLIVVAMGVVIIVLIFFTDGIGQLVNMIKNINYLWLMVAFSFVFIYWTFGAFTLATLKSGILGKKDNIGHTFKTVMIGQFFAAITPFSTGGQPAQVYFMSKKSVDAGKATSIVILKSVLFSTSMLLVSLVFFFLKKQVLISQIPNFVVLFIIGSVSNLLLIIIYFLFLLNRDVSEKAVILFLKLVSYFRKKEQRNVLHQFERIKGSLESFREGFLTISKKKSHLLLAYLFQLCQHIAIFSVPVFLIRAIEGSFFSPLSVIAATGLLMMITSLVPTPGTTGGAEGLGVYFFGGFFPNSPILSVILIWRLITYYSAILIGGVFTLISHGKTLGDIDSEN